MSLSYSTLTLDSLHFPCSSHLFPKCNTCLFQSFGQDIPFPGKFSFLETLLKPSPTTPAKKIPPPQRNLWLYNYLLYPFLHMIYVFFFTHFYSILPFNRLIYSSNCSPHQIMGSWWVEIWLTCLCFCCAGLYTIQCSKGSNYGLWVMELTFQWRRETIIEQISE